MALLQSTRVALVVSFRARTVLVTGGSGFIGRHVVAALLEQGAIVRLVTRHAPPREVPNLQICRADVTDRRSLNQLCDGIDTVLHLAGWAHSADDGSAAVAARHWAVHVQGTAQLLEVAALARVRRLVYVSSVQAVGAAGAQCVAEDWDAPPNTAYGRAKRAAEQRVLAYGTWLQTVVLRPALVYGGTLPGNLGRMLRAVRYGWLPPLPATGNRRSLVHVEDVVQALQLAALQQRAAGRTYLVTDGRYYSGREIYAALCTMLGRPLPNWELAAQVWWGAAHLIDGIRGDRKMHDTVDKLLGWAWYTPQRIMDELGYKPQWDLQRAALAIRAAHRQPNSSQPTQGSR